MNRFVVKFRNQAWVVFDQVQYRNVAAVGLEKIAKGIAQRREGEQHARPQARR